MAFARGFCLLLLATSAVASPLPTGDQNPLLAGFGLPRAMPARLAPSQWHLAADFNWGSSALIQTSATERLIVDAETRDLRLSLARRFDRWLVALSVPYRSTSGGSLDGFIDDWHDIFGLPQGARRQLPTDQLHISYERNGVSRLDHRRSVAGIGDLSAAAGWQLIDTKVDALTGWVELKMPTGSTAQFTGSEAMDLSAIIAGEHRFKERWSVFAQAAVTRLGRGDLFADMQRQWIGSATAGVSGLFWQRIELTAQVNAHTAAFDSQLDYLNEAVILDIGGTIQLNSTWRLSLGVSEDVLAETSPDVVLVLGLGRAL